MGAAGKILVGAVVVGGVILIADAVATKKAGDALKIDIDNVIFQGIRNSKAYFDIVFNYTNPTNKKLNFDYVFLDVFIGSYPVAKIREDNLGKVIPANSVAKIVLTSSTSLLQLAFNVVQFFLTKNIPDKVLITGNVRVNQYSVAYNSEYPLMLKK